VSDRSRPERFNSDFNPPEILNGIGHNVPQEAPEPFAAGRAGATRAVPFQIRLRTVRFWDGRFARIL